MCSLYTWMPVRLLPLHLLLFVSLPLFSFSEEKIKLPKAYAELANRMFEREYMGDILVSGQIVDQDGVALDGVELDARIMLGRLKDRPPTNLVRIASVGPGFQLAYTNTFGLDLSFCKRGYYKEKLSFAPNPDGARTYGGKRVVDKPELKVVLTKIGETVPLEEHFAGLECWLNGRSESARWVPSDGFNTVKLAHVQDLSLWPTTGLCLVAGELTEEFKKAVPLNGPRPGDKPPWSLVMFGTNDGFRVYSETRQDNHRIMREMRSAPEDGYVRSISPSFKGGIIYYYCRIGQRYGKGYVTYSTANPGSTSVRITTRLFVSLKEGDRNVNAESHLW